MTFDEWFFRKYHATFDELHLQPSQRIEVAMRALTVYMREYVSYVAAPDPKEGLIPDHIKYPVDTPFVPYNPFPIKDPKESK